MKNKLFKYFSILQKYFVKFGGELLIIFILIFTINNYLPREQHKIKSDGKGYYDYLPALFIYNDFLKVEKTQPNIPTEWGEREGSKVPYKDKFVIKYPCGVAILASPFFFYAHLTAKTQGFEANGYSLPYQKSMYHSALFYLFLGLIFLRLFLSTYPLSKGIIYTVLFFIVFATSIIHYTYNEPTFSHIYSFFAIAAFLYFIRKYFIDLRFKYFIWASFFIGIILVIRQVNIIIILFIPFIAGSFSTLSNGIITIFKKPLILLLGFLISLSIFSIQLYFWYKQTGDFLVYSYQGESFNFLTPAFFDILFSYKKGLFIYAPLLFISLFGLVFYIKESQYYLFITWLGFFVFINYILSSWWSWGYGCSYGLRAYIDFYPIFCIQLAILLHKTMNFIKIPIIILCVLTIPINIIQTIQYYHYILHWTSTEKKGYWQVFLKTDEVYGGLLWKKRYDFNEFNTKIIHKIPLQNVELSPNNQQEFTVFKTDTIIDFDKVNIIKVSLENDFADDQKAKIQLLIFDNSTILYDHTRPLIHFNEIDLNQTHIGEFNYEVPRFNDKNNKTIILKIHAKNKEVILKKMNVIFINLF